MVLVKMATEEVKGAIDDFIHSTLTLFDSTLSIL